MHYFVRILYDSDSFHPKRQQGGGESGTSRYVVIRHDTIIDEINTYDMSSNIKVERICEWCGKKFIAQTTVTRFCSKRCAEHSYKERLRQKKMAVSGLDYFSARTCPERHCRQEKIPAGFYQSRWSVLLQGRAKIQGIASGS